MPVQEDRSFHPSPFLDNPHLQTIFPALFRKAMDVHYVRERITLKDGDFLDIDRTFAGGNKIVILLHGLESNSSANYITRLAYLLHRMNFDVAAVNFRGCSGTPNLLFKAYHSGKTDDVAEVVTHINQTGKYEAVYMVGFSLGGNVLLKYLGEMANNLPASIISAAAVSVPCDLSSSSLKLQSVENGIYARRFLHSLKNKVKEKKNLFPSWFDINQKDHIKTIEDFDNWYTAPAHGFLSAQEYYAKSSSRFFLPSITRPTLLLNSLDDPFLTNQCMPFNEANENPYLLFSYTRKGGHVGFHSKKLFGLMHWHEKKVISFLINNHLD
jgi:predicted alpha/beta-fold hydrolase